MSERRQEGTRAERTELRRYVRALRQVLASTAHWPRDERAWARRDRLEMLLARIETERVGAPPMDQTWFRLAAELQEWFSLESDFVRDYPHGNVPATWTKREVPPELTRRVERESLSRIRTISRRLASQPARLNRAEESV